ncbi:MAG TPA: hypothetical protein VEJ18_19930 [Planctomycetota bacterium]|nr:hypothetical protein [Planctomycetota bacterium]
MVARIAALSALAILLPACGDGEDDPSGAGGGAPLAQAQIGPGGGVLETADGLRILVPPGALPASTTITIEQVFGNLPPEILQFRFGPAGTVLASPARLRIRYDEAYPRDFFLPDSPMVPVSMEPADVFPRLGQDFDGNLVEFETTRLGDFTALLEPRFADHYRFLVQDRMLAVEAITRQAGGETVVVSSGGQRVVVGKGSLEAFASSSNNLVLVHSTADQATQFVGDEDLIAGLSGAYDNIVTYQYRSGRPIAENAHWLYDEIQRRARSGFRTDILGYSMGGVVARYAVEASPAERGAGPLPVRNLFTLGAPNAGAVPAALADLIGVGGLLSFDAAGYFPGVRDISVGSDGVPARLNAAYVDDPAVRYFLVAGASNDSALSPLIPGEDDGLVSVASALGVPVLNPPEQGLVFPPAGRPGFVYTHSNLHAEAVPNGIRDQLLAWKALP